MCENASILKATMGYICTPVHHGDVAGVDVDADAVSRFGVSGTADGMQTLEGTGEPSSDEGTWTVSREACQISQVTHGDKVHFFFGGCGDGEGQPPHLWENRKKTNKKKHVFQHKQASKKLWAACCGMLHYKI